MALFDYMEQVHGSLENFFLKLSWHNFEHIVFTYFRALHLGSKVSTYENLGIKAVPEQLPVAELNLIRMAKDFESAWISFFSSLLAAPATRSSSPTFASSSISTGSAAKPIHKREARDAGPVVHRRAIRHP